MSALLDQILDAQRRLQSLGPPLGGIEIRESPMALQRSQARVYPKRRAKSAAHHRRMNKKWIKRYGWKHTPAAYWLNVDFLGCGNRRMLVAHPAIAAQIRSALTQEAPRE